MARIDLLIGGHLSTAPRPIKEADALAAAGHDVIVHGLWYDEQYAAWDELIAGSKSWRFSVTADLRPVAGSQLRRTATRVTRRLAILAYRLVGINNRNLLGLLLPRYLEACRGSELVIAHSEGALWVAAEAAKRGQRIGVDFEDWFSEDLPIDARRDRPVQYLKSLEKTVASRAAYRVTTSRVMAHAIAAAYDCGDIAVVHNAFAPEPTAPITANGPLKLNWFSQTIGPGRGLELLFDALQILGADTGIELHLRGRVLHYGPWLDQLIPVQWRQSVFVHSAVPPFELGRSTASYDVGLALEPRTVRSRDLTISNKMFQYAAAALAIIATNTLGQEEWSGDAPHGVHVVEWNDAAALATAIGILREDRRALQNMKIANHAAAAKFIALQSSTVQQSAAAAIKIDEG